MSLPKNDHVAGDTLGAAWPNDIADIVSGDVTIAAGGAAGDYTLTDDEYRFTTLIFTGTLTGNRNMILPTDKRVYICVNDCSGAFDLTIKTASGSGVIVGAGKTAILRCNSTDVKRVTADVTH